MPHFELVEAKAWHCGALSRLLRLEQEKAMTMIGLNSHRSLRSLFDDSTYRKAWLIDGKLAGVGGITGTALSASGLVWIALSNEATKYPLAIVKLMRRQLDEVMLTKNLLIITMLEDDRTAERFAIFFGFVPATDGDYVLPASSRYGRKEIARQLTEADTVRVPIGTGYARIMAYRQLEAD